MTDQLCMSERVRLEFSNRDSVLVEYCGTWLRGEMLLNVGPHPAAFLEEVGLVWLCDDNRGVTAIKHDRSTEKAP